jgi:hypothetical protein
VQKYSCVVRDVRRLFKGAAICLDTYSDQRGHGTFVRASCSSESSPRQFSCCVDLACIRHSVHATPHLVISWVQVRWPWWPNCAPSRPIHRLGSCCFRYCRTTRLPRHAGGTSDIMFVEERLRELNTPFFFCEMCYRTSFRNLEVSLSHHTKFCENRSADSEVEVGKGRFRGRSVMIS